MKNNLIKYWIFTLVLTSIGCSDSFLDEESRSLLTADNLYTSYAGFQSGLNGIHANVALERYNLAEPSELTIVFGLGGTDVITSPYWYKDLNEFGDRISPEHRTIGNVFDWLYSIINACNTIVNRAENTEIDWTEEEKAEIIGEAKYFRAWSYRHLTYLYGDVPLNLVESDGSNIKTDWERTPVNVVRAQIIEDLKFAGDNLSTEPNSEASNITVWVAKHYLAEMYLAIGENTLAEQVALEVVNGSPFSLVISRYGVTSDSEGTPFTDMFINGNRNRSEGNSEGMWNFQYEYNVIGGRASYNRRVFMMRYDRMGFKNTVERGGDGKGYLGGTSFLFDLYRQNPTDDRFSEFAWRKYYVVREGDSPKDEADGLILGDTLWLDDTYENMVFQNKKWSSSRKFEDTIEENVGTSNGYNDFTYLRLANTYLILAEALMKNGDNAGAAALINILRQRANSAEITEGDITLDFILDERGRELFGEAQRKYHLLRNNLWLSRTNMHNKFVENRATDRDKLLPIPQHVIDANITGDFPQNPGY